MADYDTDFDAETGEVSLPALPGQQIAMQTAIGDVVQVRRAAVAMPRQLAAVRLTIKEMAQWVTSTGQFDADTWEYRFPVKNRRTGKTDFIEGPTIKCTNTVARAYGNCSVDVTRVDERDNSYFIYSTFIDYQTGYQTTRVFRQRKGQVTMGNDAGRGEDIVFQIGVSKSMRNVINNALGDIVEYAIQVKRQRLVGRITEDPARYVKKITERCAEIGYSLTNIEAWSGRGTIDKWPAPVIAQVLQVLAAQAEGALANLDDVFAPGAKDITGSGPLDPAPDDDGPGPAGGAAKGKPGKTKDEPGASPEPDSSGAPDEGETNEAETEHASKTPPKAAVPPRQAKARPESATAGTNPKDGKPTADAKARPAASATAAQAPVITICGVACPTWNEAGAEIRRILADATEAQELDPDVYDELDRAIADIDRHDRGLATSLRWKLDAFTDDPQPADDSGPPASTGRTYAIHDHHGEEVRPCAALEFLAEIEDRVQALGADDQSIAHLRTANEGELMRLEKDFGDDKPLLERARSARQLLRWPTPAPRTPGNRMG